MQPRAYLCTRGFLCKAYRNDFGDYPRVETAGTGFAILAKALVGPGPAAYIAGTNDVTPTSPYAAGTVNFNSAVKTTQLVALRDTVNAPAAGPDWALFNYADGADGEGFRPRYDPANGVYSAIRPSYLGGKYKTRGLAILDHHDHPILYFPQSPTKVNLNLATGYYVASQAAIGAASRTMYNFDDNATLAASLTPENDTSPFDATRDRMRMMLGDYSLDGLINNGEAPFTQPFLLWSVGADGYFGPVQTPASFGSADKRRVAADKCDDVIHGK